MALPSLKLSERSVDKTSYLPPILAEGSPKPQQSSYFRHFKKTKSKAPLNLRSHNQSRIEEYGRPYVSKKQIKLRVVNSESKTTSTNRIGSKSEARPTDAVPPNAAIEFNEDVNDRIMNKVFFERVNRAKNPHSEFKKLAKKLGVPVSKFNKIHPDDKDAYLKLKEDHKRRKNTRRRPQRASKVQASLDVAPRHELLQSPSNLGRSLGSNVGSEEWKQRSIKADNMKQFASVINERNKQILSGDKKLRKEPGSEYRYSGRFVGDHEMRLGDAKLRKLKAQMFAEKIRKPCVGVSFSKRGYGLDHFRKRRTSKDDETPADPDEAKNPQRVVFSEQMRLLQNQRIKMFQ